MAVEGRTPTCSGPPRVSERGRSHGRRSALTPPSIYRVSHQPYDLPAPPVCRLDLEADCDACIHQFWRLCSSILVVVEADELVWRRAGLFSLDASGFNPMTPRGFPYRHTKQVSRGQDNNNRLPHLSISSLYALYFTTLTHPLTIPKLPDH